MNNLNEVIKDSRILGDRCCLRDGFYFTSVNVPHNVYDAIILRNPSTANTLSPRLGVSDRSLDEHIELVNKYNLKSAYVIADDISFITKCPSLKHLCIIPADTAPQGFDFSPLYLMPEVLSVRCVTKYGKNDLKSSSIDYSKIQGLSFLAVNAEKGNIGYNQISELKSLHLSNYKGAKRDLTDVFCSKHLDTLRLICSNITSLNGIETSQKMQCLYLHFNRSLYDINALCEVKTTIKALRIENCPKITNFSVLKELENLELLELTGSNVMDNLSFLNYMKNLKTFIFSIPINDGDLSLCRNLSYVFSIKNRSHYNIKNKNLPKIRYFCGTDGIDIWRRLE